MKMTTDTFTNILLSYTATIPEQGGILGEKDGKIVAYYHDNYNLTHSSNAIYEPNIANLNAKIHEWAKEGIRFSGIIHSHPKNESTLSNADLVYIGKIIKSYKIGDILYFPVILPGGIIIPYAITRCEVGFSVKQEDINLYN